MTEEAAEARASDAQAEIRDECLHHRRCMAQYAESLQNDEMRREEALLECLAPCTEQRNGSPVAKSAAAKPAPSSNGGTTAALSPVSARNAAAAAAQKPAESVGPPIAAAVVFFLRREALSTLP